MNRLKYDAKELYDRLVFESEQALEDMYGQNATPETAEILKERITERMQLLLNSQLQHNLPTKIFEKVSIDYDTIHFEMVLEWKEFFDKYLEVDQES
jgi:hypothetical protein